MNLVKYRGTTTYLISLRIYLHIYEIGNNCKCIMRGDYDKA